MPGEPARVPPEDREPRMRPKRSGGKVFWHPCKVCGLPYAPFGRGVDSRRGKMGEWFCADHLPEDHIIKKG